MVTYTNSDCGTIRWWKATLMVLALSFLSISLYAQIPTNYCNGTTADWTNFTTTYPIHAYAADVSNSDVGMDDQFTQGSKDESLILQWRWVNGNANDKGDITNAGAALAGTNNCYLRFFGDRTSINGDASIGFWFFVNPVTKNLDGSGTFTGTHTNGDLLILSDFTNGGGSSTITAYVWQDGALVPANLTGVEWCAGVNTTEQPVVAPLNYTPKDGGTTYPVGAFYEGAINLCQLRAQNPAISACFSYFLLETRNSQSLTASLQDFASSGFNLTPPAPTLTAVQPTCTVGTGSITVTAPTGTGMTYSLDGGTYQTSTTFSNVSVGTHTVTAKSASGCVSAGTPITINAQPATPIVPTLSAVQPTCTVATGTITVTSPTTGLQFSLDGGAYAAYPSGGWTVASGTHTVTAKNADGCISGQASIVINAQPPTPAAPTLDAVQPTCTVATGTITITSSTTGLQFSLDGGAYAAYPSGGYTGVASGSHTITAKNSDGCVSAPANITINAQPPTPAAPTLSAVQPTCTVGTGSITVTAPTGTGLTYSLDGGAFQSGTTFTNVAPGVHSVRVQNSYGCISAPTNITILAQPNTPPAPTLDAVQPTCTVATGTITITSSTTGLQFSLDGGAYAAYPSGGWTVATGTHTVTAKNNDGCISAPASIVINAQPPTPAAPTLSAVQPTCTVATGTITVTSTTTGLQFSLDGGAYAAYPSGGWTVATGTHTVTAKNNDGCISAPASIVINAQPPTPAAPTLSAVQPTCTVGTGSITVTAPTGTGYSYSLDGGAFQTSATFTSVAPGVHSVRVKNADGCISAPTSITILSQPQTPIPPAITVTQPTCEVLSGTITVTNPIAGYTYTLNTGAHNTTGVFAGLAPGNYTITATSTNSCISAASLPATVNPLPMCGETLCTYTQGAYGNAGGMYCTPGGLKTTYQLIQYALSHWTGNTLYIGRPGHSLTIDGNTTMHNDIQGVIDILPGGGPSKVLAGDAHAYDVPDTWLRNGRLTNTLLAQTITLGLNMGITTDLANLQLRTDAKLVVGDPAAGCNTASTDVEPCNYTAYDLTSSAVIQYLYNNRWNGTAFVPDLSTNKMATVSELFQLASAALGGALGTVPSGVTLDAIAALEDQINNIFDECQVFIGYMSATEYANYLLAQGCSLYTKTAIDPAARVSATDLKIAAYPNPYNHTVSFNFTSPVSGKALLEVYDLVGRRLAVVFEGSMDAGMQKAVNYNVPSAQRVPMIYKLTIGGKTSFGKLLPGNTD